MNIKIIKGLQCRNWPRSKKESHSRGIRTKLKPFRAGCTKLHLLGKRPLNKSGPQGGWYGRWEGDWNGWVGLSWNWPWSIMKPWNIQNYSTFLINGHDTNFFLRFRRSKCIICTLRSDPWSLVSLWAWRQAQSHLSSLGSHPIFSVGSGLPSWSPCFPNRVLSQHGLWRGMVHLYNTPLYGSIWNFCGKNIG